MSIFSTIRERYKIQKGEDIREVSFKDLQSAEPVNEVSAKTELEAFISVIENSRRGGRITVKETDDIDQFFNAMEKPTGDKLVTDLMSLDTGLEKSSAIKFAKGIRALHDSAAVHIPDDIDKQRNSMKM